KAVYLKTVEHNAALLAGQWDCVFIHDPQPLAILSKLKKGDARFIWRCHIDTSHPNPELWNFLLPYLNGYDAAIFTMEQFVPKDMPVRRVEIIPPAIDPLSPKNFALQENSARDILQFIVIRPDR